MEVDNRAYPNAELVNLPPILTIKAFQLPQAAIALNHGEVRHILAQQPLLSPFTTQSYTASANGHDLH